MITDFATVQEPPVAEVVSGTKLPILQLCPTCGDNVLCYVTTVEGGDGKACWSGKCVECGTCFEIHAWHMNLPGPGEPDEN